MKNLLVIGSIMSDLLMRLHHIPEGGETIMVREQSWQNGGKGANQAVAAARMGMKTTLCGVVGEDEIGAKLKKSIENEGISSEHIYETSEAATGLAVIMLEDNGQNRIMVSPGANMLLTPSIAAQALEKGYDALLLQLEMPPETVISACNAAMAKGMKVVLDAGPAQAFDIEAIQGIDILSPNRSETEALTGIKVDDMESAKAACRILKERSHAKHIVLKLDKEGALLYNENICTLYPPCKVQPVDTTGAGDAFTAALTKWYIETDDIESAMIAANAAGAIAVTKLGAQPSLPYLAEVEGIMREGKTKTNCYLL